jgi:hypothetical protein
MKGCGSAPAGRCPRRVAPPPLGVVVLIVVALEGGCTGSMAKDPRDEKSARVGSVAVYALSRGKGVPDVTQTALGSVRDLLQSLRRTGDVTRIEDTRIGLEGETRLCAEFKDADAARAAIERIRKIATGVELLNVSEEPCDKP